jgi:tetratricopeptide (TPR) repeat protein
MVEPSLQRGGIKIEECGIPIHHYGPLIKNRAHSKMQAYYRIGQKKLNSSGEQTVSLYELAIQAANLGKPAEASRLWEKFIALKSDLPEAFVHLATAYFQNNNYHSALQASKKALELAPEMKEALYNYSLCEFIIGDIGEAIAYLEYLLDSSPEFLPARFLLAAAHICSGNKQKGRKRFKELSQTEMGPNLNATCRELAQRLVDDNRIDSAKLLIETSQGL